jgi:putative intracellular protease/amidase
MAKAATKTKIDDQIDSDVGDDTEEGILAFSEDIGEAEAPEPLPERDYPATIEKVDGTKTTKDGRRMVAVTFKISEEDYPADYDAGNAPGGTSLTHFLMADDVQASRHRMRRFCEAIGAPMGKQIRVTEWIGLRASLGIKHEEYEGVNRAKISKVSEE